MSPSQLHLSGSLDTMRSNFCPKWMLTTCLGLPSRDIPGWPSGKLTVWGLENHNFSLANQLFLWPWLPWQSCVKFPEASDWKDTTAEWNDAFSSSFFYQLSSVQNWFFFWMIGSGIFLPSMGIIMVNECMGIIMVQLRLYCQWIDDNYHGWWFMGIIIIHEWEFRS